MYQKFRTKKLGIVTLIIPLLLSCSEVMLIGAYNQNVDEDIQTVSKDLSTLFVQVEKNATDGKDYSYSAFRDSYVKIESEIESVGIIANALPKYQIISQQIHLLDSTVHCLENDHKSGFVTSPSNAVEVKKSIAADMGPIRTALSAMIGLQDGLKRTKANKNK